MQMYFQLSRVSTENYIYEPEEGNNNFCDVGVAYKDPRYPRRAPFPRWPPLKVQEMVTSRSCPGHVTTSLGWAQCEHLGARRLGGDGQWEDGVSGLSVVSDSSAFGVRR